MRPAQPRPACLVVGVGIAALCALLLLSMGFALIYLRSPLGVDAFKLTRECYNDKEICGHLDEVLLKVAERESGLSINTLLVVLFGLGTLTAASLIGLWQLKSWGVMMIGLSWSLFGLWLLVSGQFLGVLLLLLLAASLLWFVRNRWRFALKGV